MYTPETENFKPFPKSRKELDDIIDKIVSSEHDYNTAAEAMADAAIAAFNYVAAELGCTGFQASWGELQFIKRSRGIDGPFMLIKLDDALYPQYNLQNRLTEFINDNRDWMRDEAQKNIDKYSNDSEFPPADVVMAHWQKLAAWSDNA